MSTVLPQAGGRILASIIASVAPLAVIKASDESVTSSTTLQSDNELFVPVVASATYIFVCCLDYEGGTQGSSDFKWGWSVPSGAVLRAFRANITTAGAVSIGMSTSANVPVAGTAGAGTLEGALIVGSLAVSSTAGNLQLQWAQGTTPSATATIVHAQSFLALWRVS